MPKQYFSTTFKARYFGIIKVYCEVSIFLSLIKISVIEFQIFGEKKDSHGLWKKSDFCLILVFILFVAIFSTAGQEFSGDLRGGESRLPSAKKICINYRE